MRYALEGLRRRLAEAGVTGDEADAQRTGTRAGTP
jgi:hypothetical protein